LFRLPFKTSNQENWSEKFYEAVKDLPGIN
jgi:hypothetical protein